MWNSIDAISQLSAFALITSVFQSGHNLMLIQHGIRVQTEKNYI